MKILHIAVNDIQGGAQRASYRLHKGLLQIGEKSQLLVSKKFSNDPTVIKPRYWSTLSRLRFETSTLIGKLKGENDQIFMLPTFFHDGIQRQIKKIQPDIINLHWVSGGFLNPRSIRNFKIPTVWTLHDMWAFTGGCHYSGGCKRYEETCGHCRVLDSKRGFDSSRWVWKTKHKAWNNIKHLVIVTPSRWLGECAQESSLFAHRRIEVIPYGLNHNRFKPIDRQTGRKFLGFSQGKKLILFGTSILRFHRKGFRSFEQAVQILSQQGWSKDLEIMIFGSSYLKGMDNLGVETHYLGRFSDDVSLAMIYATSDVFVASSTEDNLPNTVMEALACGTPVVAFNIGGMPDMIEHKQNGYLAEPFDCNDLAKGIAWVLEDRQRWQKLAYRARKKIEQEFTLDMQARQYLKLYQDI